MSVLSDYPQYTEVTVPQLTGFQPTQAEMLLSSVVTTAACVLSRPAVAQPYNQGAVNLSGPPQPYPQQYGAPPPMQQVTNQMTGMQISSGPPTAAGPGYGKTMMGLQLQQLIGGQ